MRQGLHGCPGRHVDYHRRSWKTNKFPGQWFSCRRPCSSLEVWDIPKANQLRTWASDRLRERAVSFPDIWTNSIATTHLSTCIITFLAVSPIRQDFESRTQTSLSYIFTINVGSMSYSTKVRCLSPQSPCYFAYP